MDKKKTPILLAKHLKNPKVICLKDPDVLNKKFESYLPISVHFPDIESEGQKKREEKDKQKWTFNLKN